MRSSRLASSNTTARSAETCTTPSPCCWRWATATKKPSRRIAPRTRPTADGTGMFEIAVFYLFAVVLVLAAVVVITARNPVHAALFLVLAFFTASAIWLLLRAEFLAITLVLVYVGAVMVLFLFVVMMLDVDSATLHEGFWKHFPLAAFVGAVIALEMAAVLLPGFRLVEAPAPDAAALQAGNTRL